MDIALFAVVRFYDIKYGESWLQRNNARVDELIFPNRTAAV